MNASAIARQIETGAAQNWAFVLDRPKQEDVFSLRIVDHDRSNVEDQVPDNQEDKYDQLARTLYNSDLTKAIEAATELFRIGDEGIWYLVTELTDLAKPTRVRISEMVRSRFTFDALKEWAEKDKSTGVLLLGISQYAGAFDVLLKILNQKLMPHVPTLEELHVWDVIDALGLLGDKRALSKLQELELEGMSKYKDIDIQKSAKIAIKNIGQTT